MRLVGPDDVDVRASGATRPARLFVHSVEVSNAIDSLDWSVPTQLVLCTHCWTPRCSSGGYAHVSRAGEHVLWTGCRTDPALYSTSTALEDLGGLAFTGSAWAALRHAAGAPSAASFPDANASIFLATILGSMGCETVREASDRLRKTLLAATSLDVGDAAARVDSLLRDLGRSAADDWALETVDPADCEAETLYLDGQRVVEWQVLTRFRGDVVPTLAPGLLLRHAR